MKTTDILLLQEHWYFEKDLSYIFNSMDGIQVYGILARLINVSMQRTVPVKTHTARFWSIYKYLSICLTYTTHAQL